jgi:gluconate kinase
MSRVTLLGWRTTFQLHKGGRSLTASAARRGHWIPVSTVLSQIDPAENARADFEAGVVRVTVNEYETALAVAAARATSTG